MRLALALLLLPLSAPAEVVTVFAAASLGPAMAEVSEGFEAQTGHEMRLVLAASSVLARQIAAGAPADLFLSASVDWAETVEARARVDLARNTLVLIAAEGAPDTALAELPEALGTGRLAVALTESVPAGLYARAALETLGLWEALAPRLAQADNVRGALSFVALGVAPYGIVYGSDVLQEPRVRVLETFPEDSHPPIVYPALLLTEGAGARALFAHLQAPETRAILAAHGFLPP